MIQWNYFNYGSVNMNVSTEEKYKPNDPSSYNVTYKGQMKKEGK